MLQVFTAKNGHAIAKTFYTYMESQKNHPFLVRDCPFIGNHFDPEPPMIDCCIVLGAFLCSVSVRIVPQFDFLIDKVGFYKPLGAFNLIVTPSTPIHNRTDKGARPTCFWLS